MGSDLPQLSSQYLEFTHIPHKSTVCKLLPLQMPSFECGGPCYIGDLRNLLKMLHIALKMLFSTFYL